jgi:eukaryotic-like serine/threonine-protein kinase
MNRIVGTGESFTKSFESFGNYLFLKRLAAGGMAEVFLARPANQNGNGRVQVVKRILPHVADNRDFLQMFQSEIQVILGFNHPHTVQLHDFGEFNRQPYIAMEYIEGKNLKELIGKLIVNKTSMPVPVALGLVMQAATGINYAHTFVNKVTGQAVNAIHRDISPHNLLLSYDGNLKVIDFGIAKAATSIYEPTTMGTLKGKIAYMSPEQINGQPVDARSDIFSLGIVAWELLTLSRPFCKENDSEMTILSRINDCDRNILPPSQINPEIPKELDEIILKAIRKNPDERYSSAADFQKALREVMMKHYPDHSYADTSRLVHTLFELEIVNERKELQDLNSQAQMDLTPSSLGETQVLSDVQSPIFNKNIFGNSKKSAPEMSQVDLRLSVIESMMKQKAKQRHYLLFIFYIVSLVAIKSEDSFAQLYNLISPTRLSENQQSNDEDSHDLNSRGSKQNSGKQKSRSTASVQKQKSKK